MADIELASLAIKIDASSADPATASLEKLADASGRAEGAAKKTGGASTELARSVRNVGDEARKYEQQVEKLVGPLRDAEAMTGRLTAAQRLASSAMEGQGAAVQALRPAVVGLVGALTPLMGLLGPLAIVSGALALAWLEGEKSALGYDRAVSGVGRTARVTSEELRNLAVAGAEQGNISLRAAQEQATAYIQTGRIGSASMASLLAIGKDYASFMGVEAPAATRMLAEAMKDPDKAAVEMTRSFGLLTQEQIKQVEAAVKSGDASRAQRILLDELTDAVSGHASQVGQIESAWDAVGQAVSNAITRLGEFLYMSKDEEIAQREAALRSPFVLPSARRAREQELADLRFQQGYERAARANAAALGVLNQRQQAVTDGLDRARPARAAAVRGMSDEERAYQTLIRAATSMLESLDEQAATYGMTEDALLRYRTTQQVQALAANGWLQEEVDLANKLLTATETLIARQRDLTQVFDEAPNRQLQPLNIAPVELEDRLVTFARELREIDDIALDLGESLSRSFGQAGQALGDVISTMTGYRAQVADLFAEAGSNEDKRAKATQKAAILESQAYGDMAGAAKNFFGEKTAAYQALQAVEIAYRAAQLVGATQAMAIDATETGSSISNSLARGAASAAAGVAKIFDMLGPFGFPVAAAAIGVMASVGLRGLAGGSGPAPALPATNTGTGTVSGSPDAQSESLSRSLELAEKYYARDLDYSNKQLTALRAIQSNIGSLTTSIAREMSLGGALSTEGLNLGTTTVGASGILKFFSPLLGSMLNTTRTSELVGQGLNLNGGQLADLIAKGVSGSFYQLIQNTKTKSGFLGFGGGTTTWNTETSTPIDGAVSQELGRILGSLRAGVLQAAGQLGIEGAAATLDALTISLGRIDFTGLSSSEINERLSAVFSAVGDQMASALLPQLSAFQRAGEGMMETLSRLATEFRTVDVTLQSIGMVFGAVGLASLEARTRLVELSGGLDAFVEGASFFAQNFLTDAQRIAPIQAAVTAELTRLGVASDISRSGFASLVMGLDVSTEAGSTMFAALMRLAPALDQVISYTDGLTGAVTDLGNAAQIASQRRQLEITLMEAQGNASGALLARRELELQAMDASLRPLQLAIYSAQDAAAAQAALAAAQEAGARAAEEAAQRVAAIARQRTDLEIQLLDLTGHAAEALAMRRQLELDGMDASLRALQMQIYAQEDLASAAEAARNAWQEVSSSYDSQAELIRAAHSRFIDYAKSLNAYRASLDDEGRPASSNFSASRSDFQRVASLAALGNEEALQGLQGVSEAYLAQSKEYSKSSLDYLRDISAVRSAVQKAEETAYRTAAQTDRNLMVLGEQLSELRALNMGISDVASAIRNPNGTPGQSGQSGVPSPSTTGSSGNIGWEANWGAASQMAEGVEKYLSQYFGVRGVRNSAGFNAFLAQQDEATKAIARQTFEANGLIPGFATGGSFTVGGVGGPDSQLVPLRLTPGEMVDIKRPGANDNQDIVAELRALNARMARVEAASMQTVVNTGKQARLMDRWDGDGLPEEREVAA